LRVQFQLIRLDTPLLLLVTGGFGWFFRDREISRAEAAVLCAGLVGYTLLNLHLARRTATETVTTEFDAALPRPSRHWAVDVGLIAGGLGLLVLGARLLVDSASALARGWGVSEAVIGLTIVAAGTSLPELATTLVAALRKQPDIAVGNVVGSNLYNLLAIAGISGLLAPLAGPGIRVFDLVTLMVLTVILFPLLWTGLMVKRWEGGVLLGSYAVYLAVLWPK
jgi:cation:H+ antiporter